MTMDISTAVQTLRDGLSDIRVMGQPVSPITSFAVQADLVPVFAEAAEAGNVGQILILQAAAVGLACKPLKVKAKYVPGSVMTYGAAALDELSARDGFSLTEIGQAGSSLLILAGAEFARTAGVAAKARDTADFFGQKRGA